MNKTSEYMQCSSEYQYILYSAIQIRYESNSKRPDLAKIWSFGSINYNSCCIGFTQKCGSLHKHKSLRQIHNPKVTDWSYNITCCCTRPGLALSSHTFTFNTIFEILDQPNYKYNLALKKKTFLFLSKYSSFSGSSYV